MKLAIPRISALLLISFAIISCRGQVSDKPPVHPNQNMDVQNRFNAQEENPFFEDGRSMRMPVEGTIARGNLRQDHVLYEGVDEGGNYVGEIPFELTRSFMNRGKERFDVFCTPCHGGAGDGRGIIMTGNYGYVPAPSFHTDQSRNMPVGEFYAAIKNGIRTMPSYASQIKVEDRWAIVSYIRALQRSQNIPESEMQQFDVDLADLQEAFREQQEREEALAASRAVSGDEEITAERGERLYIQNSCNACHSLDGSILVGPSFQGLFGSERTFDDGSSATADEEYLMESITEPGARVVEGFQNAMVPYDFLSDSEVQSLVEFIKTQSEN
ncbi:MAG: c-type cytochrome [Balneolaceae bacterium]